MNERTIEMKAQLAPRTDYQAALQTRNAKPLGSAFIGILALIMTAVFVYGSAFLTYKSGKFVFRHFEDNKIVRSVGTAIDDFVDTLFE